MAFDYTNPANINAAMKKAGWTEALASASKRALDFETMYAIDGGGNGPLIPGAGSTVDFFGSTGKIPFADAMKDLPGAAAHAAANGFQPEQSTFDRFTAWFDATRIVTVILGLLLFGAGVFLLGKGTTGDAIVSAAKKAVT